MSNFVRDTPAAKAISAYVVLSPTGEEVATINLHFTASRCLVNVWQSEDAAKRSADYVHYLTFSKAADFRCKVKPNKDSRLDPAPFRFMQSVARGYGYDKKTSALAGLVIDGIALTDHCSRFGAPDRPGAVYPSDFPVPAGYTLANYRSGDSTWSDGSPRFPDMPKDSAGYTDCYRHSGLEILSRLGYRVIQAI